MFLLIKSKAIANNADGKQTCKQLPNPKTAQKKNALAAKIILANVICKVYYGASK